MNQFEASTYRYIFDFENIKLEIVGNFRTNDGSMPFKTDAQQKSILYNRVIPNIPPTSTPSHHSQKPIKAFFKFCQNVSFRPDPLILRR